LVSRKEKVSDEERKRLLKLIQQTREQGH
jgi:hypothetical protein